MPPKEKRARASRKTAQQPGDQIKVTNRGERSAIAAGRHSLAAVFNFGDLKWQPVVIVLVIVGAFLAVILWFVVPRVASKMTGTFNVAVARFLVQDKNGKTKAGDDGSLLADYVAKQITTQFEAIGLKKTVPYEVWGPDKVAAIAGDTADERRLAAAKLAEKIGAHVLIYGTIIADGDQSKFMPEFYINHKGFWQASEIGGPHDMGSQLLVTLPFSSSIQSIDNPALAGRVRALDLITLGLAYFSVDDYQNAASYFEQAVAEPRWLKSSGKEVGYILAGNAYVGWASKDNDSQYLPQAEQNYAEALKANPDYGRGLVGMANVLYLESLGSLQNIKIDPAKLDEAEVLTEKALSLADQPENVESDIAAKAHFNLGQIAWARYRAQLPGGDWAEEARSEFTFVTQAYETENKSGDTALATYAAHAYERLGLIEYAQNKSDSSVETAISLVEKAIALAPPFYQGEYSITLGNIYKATGQKDLAEQAYGEALAYAEKYGDAKSAERYQKILDTLDGP